MEKRGINGIDLAQAIDITQANLSRIRTGKAKAIRLDTLEKLCVALKCKPVDILDYYPEPPTKSA
jgi:putative transcriptional regulator